MIHDAAIGNTYIDGTLTENYSDERLKTFTGGITSALNKVKAIEGRYFIPNALAKSLNRVAPEDWDEENDEYIGRTEVGVSAQQVQAVLPEIVHQAPFSRPDMNNGIDAIDYLTVDYKKMNVLLLEAIKELSDKVDTLS